MQQNPIEKKQKMKKEKVLLDTWQAFMNRVGFSPPKLLFGEPYARLLLRSVPPKAGFPAFAANSAEYALRRVAYETNSMKGKNKHDVQGFPKNAPDTFFRISTYFINICPFTIA